MDDDIHIEHATGTIQATQLSLALSVRLASGSSLRLKMLSLVPEGVEIFNPKQLQPIPDVQLQVAEHAKLRLNGRFCRLYEHL